jgi:hypothetical protein
MTPSESARLLHVASSTNASPPMAFTATYSDGYQRTIAGPINSLKKATKYAQDLESWFNSPSRKLVSVEPKG